ncbi:MAG: type II secretion system protein GspG [Planctomycetota bacterium]|jgi:general secretion pathway protein G
MRTAHKTLRSRAAFTLIEILLVILLVGILASAMGYALVSTGNQARIDLTYTKMETIKQALDTYNIRNGSYPTTTEGLLVLIPGYLESDRSLQDPWKMPFAYYSPVQDAIQGFDLRSNGPDKQAGTEDDISIWDVR